MMFIGLANNALGSVYHNCMERAVENRDFLVNDKPHECLTNTNIDARKHTDANEPGA